MYCQNCGKQIPDGSKFCQFCGEKLQPVVAPKIKKTIKPKKEKKPLTKEKKIKIITIGAVSAVLAVVILYFVLYFSAGKLVDKEDFTKANKCLPLYKLTAMHDPNLVKYVHAGITYDAEAFEESRNEFIELGDYRDSAHMANKSYFGLAIQELDNKNYAGAIVKFRELSKTNFEDADIMIDETNYREGIDLFDNSEDIHQKILGFIKIKNLSVKDYSDSKKAYEYARDVLYDQGVSEYCQHKYDNIAYIFQNIGDYKDSKKYIDLAEVRRGLALINPDDYIEKLERQLSFEDTKEALVCKNEIANAFLEGTWKTANGNNYFTIKKVDYSHNCSYNLPYLDLANSYYEIEDGVYKLYNDTTHKNVFKFTVNSADQINIYCYKNGSTYTLYRQ